MKQDEFTPLPREYGTGTTEFVPPGPEFEGHAPSIPPRYKRKSFMAAAAILLLAVLVFLPTVPAPPAENAPVPAAATPAPTEAAPVPTEAPSEQAIPPEPELAGPPTCQTVFFAFSDALRAKLVFTHADSIISVRAELWDSLGETLEQAWEVPLEAIAQGEYILPDMMGMYDMYMAHHDSFDPADPFPVPQLRIAMTYLDGETETTTELTQDYREEQGWSVRAVDGEIRFRTYESYTPITLYAGDNPQASEALESGELLVVVRINGETVPTSQCLISQDEDTWFTADGESITFYYASLTVPQQGESGEVLVTVYQKLQGYDTIWSEAVELTY